MTSELLVVGLSGRTPADDWEPLLAGRTIVARCRHLAETVLPSGWTITHAYDALLEEEPLAGAEDRIADDVVRRSGEAPLAYLVPGPGWIGDVTVDALRQRHAVKVASGSSLPVIGNVQVIDALMLAQAQEQAPFDAGINPIDATVPAVVFNCHGRRVTDFAGQRLQSVYGMSDVPAPDVSGIVHIPARDPLESPPSFAALEYITARLRRPDGCPWDREQTHESMLGDFASEVDEYAEAVRSGDWAHAAEELGDVLLNVLMQAQIGTEAGHFSMAEVLSGITAKLVRRHPHVFAGVDARTPDEVLAVWNSVKAQERSSEPRPGID